jgi:hypothetical protein
MLQDIGMPGHDLKSYPSSTAGGCCGKCEALKDCGSFTWWQNVCYLKAAAAAAGAHSIDGRISGVVNSTRDAS